MKQTGRVIGMMISLLAAGITAELGFQFVALALVFVAMLFLMCIIDCSLNGNGPG